MVYYLLLAVDMGYQKLHVEIIPLYIKSRYEGLFPDIEHSNVMIF